MTNGTRVPTWRERENNRRRERKRRAIAARIFAGLRAYGNYDLPKHCDNNEVLKALCREAGWTVEPDGTTYRTGSRPPTEHMDVIGGSAGSSYRPSPNTSCNPSPVSSSFPSSGSSSYMANGNHFGGAVEGNSLIPWLRNLTNISAGSPSKYPKFNHVDFQNGSISAPVTPPCSSPTHKPRLKMDWDSSSGLPPWAAVNYTSLPNSTPPSPGRQLAPDPAWLAGFQISSAGPSSPTFSLVARNPFGMTSAVGGSSMTCTPARSGTCSPAITGIPFHANVPMMDAVSHEFAFGSTSNVDNKTNGPVKAWEGERIHEESASDELELTLGSSRTRADA